MHLLKTYIKQAADRKIAIGHFNISNIEVLWAIFNAAKSLKLPVIIGTSEKERQFIGTKQAVALVRSIREEFDYPIFLNADHCYSFETAKEAIDAGYDAVIYDGADQPFEVNVRTTKETVEYARSKNPNIVVEGELGYKGTASQVLDSIPKGVELGPEYLTHGDEAKRFVEQTVVDLLAPAVGNFHGMLKGGDPALNIETVKEVKEATGIPLVLHGASGNSAEDIKKSIAAGMAIVHVSTELRVAYRKALEETLAKDRTEVATYKLIEPARDAVEKLVIEKLKIFNNLE